MRYTTASTIRGNETMVIDNDETYCVAVGEGHEAKAERIATLLNHHDTTPPETTAIAELESSKR
jgi:hypothetical protein